MQQYFPGTAGTPEEVEEGRRTIKRLDDYDATIDIWENKMQHAARMLRETREAKERFIASKTHQRT